MEVDTPPGATAVGLVRGADANAQVVIASLGGTVASGGRWTAPKQAVEQVTAEVKGKPNRQAFRLAFIKNGKLTDPGVAQPFYVTPAEDADKAVACKEAAPALADLAANTPTTTPAPPEVCAALAEERTVRNHSWILFDSKGVICHVPYPVRQYDTLHVGVVVNTGEVLPARRSTNVTGCTTPAPGVRVFSSGSLPQLQSGPSGQTATRASSPTVLETVGSPLSCSSDSVTVAVSIDGGQAGQGQAVPLYQRHTATLHLGVLASKLREPDYALRSTSAGSVITDREAEQRGTQYVAAVVVQAFPRYFMKGGGFGYPGRDLLHDNDVADRTGLLLVFGLKEPTKRFGLGLSYEIANGINLLVVREWNKQTALDGVAVGSAFTGDATAIPTKQTWAKGTSFGLSFDLGYVNKVFGSK
ncbi:hypothetical protein [Ideonella sp. BN130291]|uniref:hypothetical protein n=1 Tax=Ideonella sp. BN130291 TaxID=3112940 RepID=UPI002E25F0B4|nr:hypothetical protein [Ideonella sp. BN130291]